RLGQTVLVGELISGVLLGAIVSNYAGSFPVLATLGENDVFQALRDFGIFFLMLMAGMELAPQDFNKNWKKAVIIGAYALLTAFIMGAAVGLMFIEPNGQQVTLIFF